MANTYVAIATVTVGSGSTTSIEFSSIPSTYTDLLLKISARNSSGGDQGIFIKFNNSTSNRSHRYLASDGSSASSSSGTDGYIGTISSSATASIFNNTEVYISNYAGSNNKSFSVDNVTENNAASPSYMNFVAGLWSNSSAITSINIYIGSAGTINYSQYSTATLYGIKNS